MIVKEFILITWPYVCVCVWAPLTVLRISPKFRLRWRLAVSRCVSSVWQFLTQHTAGEADWHNDMFIEKLWIIEKVVAAAGMSQPLTKKHGHEISYLDTHTHARSHTHASPQHTLKEGKNLQQCTGRDGNHSFYKLISTWKIHSYTYSMREVFFIGTAKAVRCLSQQQQNKDEK